MMHRRDIPRDTFKAVLANTQPSPNMPLGERKEPIIRTIPEAATTKKKAAEAPNGRRDDEQGQESGAC